MLAYSVIMFCTALLFLSVSIAICKGKTELIHSYHQTKVTDHAAYGKAFGKALSVLAAAPFVSGMIALMGTSDPIALIAVAVLIAGIGIGIGCIVAVQRKHNKGVF